MILIADSGSSKTDWRLIEGEHISQFECIGLNPYIVDEQTITSTIGALNIPFLKIKELHFYGAGCASSEKSSSMQALLQSLFKQSKVLVHSDLLAAAHSLLKNKEGIVGILGTGSNLAHYDGKHIRPLSTSMGYLLGDEGSGNALGKRLLKAFFKDELDKDLCQIINQDKATILEQLYNNEFPNRYLASFAKMIFRNRKHPLITKLIIATFEEWIQECLLPHDVKNIHLCGSIAYYFSAEIRTQCQKYEISVENIIEKPIAALTLYHIENK